MPFAATGMDLEIFILDFLLWHKGIGSTMGALGSRFDPLPGTVLLQLQLKSQLQLRSDPWPRNSICHRVDKNKNKNNQRGCHTKWSKSGKKKKKDKNHVISLIWGIQNMIQGIPCKLRTRCCRCYGHSCGKGLLPGPRTSTSMGVTKKYIYTFPIYMNDSNELIYKRDSQTKNKLTITWGGRWWRRDKLGVWD